MHTINIFYFFIFFFFALNKTEKKLHFVVAILLKLCLNKFLILIEKASITLFIFILTTLETLNHNKFLPYYKWRNSNDISKMIPSNQE